MAVTNGREGRQVSKEGENVRRARRVPIRALAVIALCSLLVAGVMIVPAERPIVLPVGDDGPHVTDVLSVGGLGTPCPLRAGCAGPSADLY